MKISYGTANLARNYERLWNGFIRYRYNMSLSDRLSQAGKLLMEGDYEKLILLANQAFSG
jgi:hypothetical protein